MIKFALFIIGCCFGFTGREWLALFFFALALIWHKKPHQLPTNPKNKKTSFRGITYQIHQNRHSFHESFLSPTTPTNHEIHTCQMDYNGRVIGAFTTFTGEILTKQRRLIKEGKVKRDRHARQTANVPGMDIAKREFTSVGGEPHFHYHRTHLIPFRLCLNDGEFANMMFTGTARLNTGSIPQKGYTPTNDDHARNSLDIVSKVKQDPFYYEKNHTEYSLDDFERAIDLFVHESASSYKNTFKYGTECLYELDTIIPTHVRVLFVNMTTKKVLFSAILKNTLR